MATLVGLPGISAPSREAERINKASDIKNILEAGLAGTTAGENGAINVWEDDKGFIRCERHKLLQVVDNQEYTKVKDAIAWTKSALLLIERK